MNSPETSPEFEALLNYLKQNRGCDLTGYKRSTLRRRFQHRMQTIKINNYQSYLQYLQSDPEEYQSLLNDVLINVTSFFRDQEVWDYLASEIIPRIIASKEPTEPIRVWSAGCASGQEIYSLLMLLAETLGIETCLKRVQAYATDLDEVALRQARKGTYSDLEIMGIPEHWLEKYFEQTEKGYVFNAQLRRTIIFGHHDLAQDAPMSKIDLLMCRNVLIYFNTQAQESILVRFHFALKNTGFLVMGKAETLVNRRLIFNSINLKQRVYRKGLNLEIEDNLLLNPNKSRQKQLIDPLTRDSYFWRTAFETNPFAQLAIDANGYLLRSNQQANRIFGLTLDDWNRPFLELDLGKLLTTKTSVETFYRHNYPLTLKNIQWITSDGIQYFDVAIAPVFNSYKQLLGITLSFLNKTDSKQLSQKLEAKDSQLARVSQMLQLIESELHTSQMQLEAAHQEIQVLCEEAEYRN